MLNARDSANTCRKKLSYERVFTVLTDVEMTMIRCELKGCERHMMDFTQTERSHECKTHIEILSIRCYRLELFILTNAVNIISDKHSAPL